MLLHKQSLIADKRFPDWATRGEVRGWLDADNYIFNHDEISLEELHKTRDTLAVNDIALYNMDGQALIKDSDSNFPAVINGDLLSKIIGIKPFHQMYYDDVRKNG